MVFDFCSSSAHLALCMLNRRCCVLGCECVCSTLCSSSSTVFSLWFMSVSVYWCLIIRSLYVLCPMALDVDCIIWWWRWWWRWWRWKSQPVIIKLVLFVIESFIVSYSLVCVVTSAGLNSTKNIQCWVWSLLSVDWIYFKSVYKIFLYSVEY